MKIGYPCINKTIGCTSNSTFRLKNYSEDNFIAKVNNNLECLSKIIDYNIKNKILFFRLSSDIIPFASHSVCKFNWQSHFKKKMQKIGDVIKENNIRISMHPDQFVLLNALNNEIVDRSIKELDYHCSLLDSMGLNSTAKVQIHIGGVYGDKLSAMKRFMDVYNKLPFKIKKRLAIENDHKLYSLKDCMLINKKTQIPVIFDSFHHECLNNKEPLNKAIILASSTWKNKDGILMMDYSSQKKDARHGSHSESLNLNHFKNFLMQAKGLNFDLMLEIKDKERSALKAMKIINEFNMNKI
ncbi:MAG: UV DNA damage repair endonuclease UvsE [Candidatus Woesearchaeota archaeon]